MLPLSLPLKSQRILAPTQLVAVGISSTLPPSHVGGKSAGSNGGAALASSGTVTKHFYTFWVDPVGAAVNEVKDNATVTSNGTYISSFSGSDNRWWLTESGWYEVYGHLSTYLSGSFTYGQVSTCDRFVNPNFAGCGETDTYYQPNSLVVHGDLSANGSVNTWVTGKLLLGPSLPDLRTLLGPSQRTCNSADSAIR